MSRACNKRSRPSLGQGGHNADEWLSTRNKKKISQATLKPAGGHRYVGRPPDLSRSPFLTLLDDGPQPMRCVTKQTSIREFFNPPRLKPLPPREDANPGAAAALHGAGRDDDMDTLQLQESREVSSAADLSLMYTDFHPMPDPSQGKSIGHDSRDTAHIGDKKVPHRTSPWLEVCSGSYPTSTIQPTPTASGGALQDVELCCRESADIRYNKNFPHPTTRRLDDCVDSFPTSKLTPTAKGGSAQSLERGRQESAGKDNVVEHKESDSDYHEQTEHVHDPAHVHSRAEQRNGRCELNKENIGVGVISDSFQHSDTDKHEMNREKIGVGVFTMSDSLQTPQFLRDSVHTMEVDEFPLAAEFRPLRPNLNRMNSKGSSNTSFNSSCSISSKKQSSFGLLAGVKGFRLGDTPDSVSNLTKIKSKGYSFGSDVSSNSVCPISKLKEQSSLGLSAGLNGFKFGDSQGSVSNLSGTKAKTSSDISSCLISKEQSSHGLSAGLNSFNFSDSQDSDSECHVTMTKYKSSQELNKHLWNCRQGSNSLHGPTELDNGARRFDNNARDLDDDTRDLDDVTRDPDNDVRDLDDDARDLDDDTRDPDNDARDLDNDARDIDDDTRYPDNDDIDGDTRYPDNDDIDGDTRYPDNSTRERENDARELNDSLLTPFSDTGHWQESDNTITFSSLRETNGSLKSSKRKRSHVPTSNNTFKALREDLDTPHFLRESQFGSTPHMGESQFGLTSQEPVETGLRKEMLDSLGVEFETRKRRKYSLSESLDDLQTPGFLQQYSQEDSDTDVELC